MKVAHKFSPNVTVMFHRILSICAHYINVAILYTVCACIYTAYCMTIWIFIYIMFIYVYKKARLLAIRTWRCFRKSLLLFLQDFVSCAVSCTLAMAMPPLLWFIYLAETVWVETNAELTRAKLFIINILFLYGCRAIYIFESQWDLSTKKKNMNWLYINVQELWALYI